MDRLESVGEFPDGVMKLDAMRLERLDGFGIDGHVLVFELSVIERPHISQYHCKHWRRGYESNIPRPAKRADNGFEDREGHQAPITLRRRCC